MSSVAALELQVLSDDISNPVFQLVLSGFIEGTELDLRVMEVANPADKEAPGDRVLATLHGKIVVGLGDFALDHDPQTDWKASASSGTPASLIVSQQPGVSATGSLKFHIPNSRKDEGDYWEIQVTAELSNLSDDAVSSNMVTIARVRRQLPPGVKTTYDWHAGNTVTFYADGSDTPDGSTGAFHDIAEAIRAAKHFIFIFDWSFQAYFAIDRPKAPALESTIGYLLNQAAARGVSVAVHTWKHIPRAAEDSVNDSGGSYLDEIAKAMGLGACRPSTLLWRASPRRLIWCSHHQKAVICDSEAPDGRRQIRTFFGGLDLTKGRMDCYRHPIADDSDAKAAQFMQRIAGHSDWYNAETADNETLPRQPWHDIHACVSGPAAWDFLREFVGRWLSSPSLIDKALAVGDVSEDACNQIRTVVLRVTSPSVFVQQSESATGPWAAQIYRSIEATQWDVEATSRASLSLTGMRWSLPSSFERSIQDAYLQSIAQAERFIYIETQYLIGSGKHWRYEPAANSLPRLPLSIGAVSDSRPTVQNQIPEKLVQRILHHAKKGSRFHAYVVCPMFPEGEPLSKVAVVQRYYEWLTMEYMVLSLNETLGERWRDYLSFYFLVRADGCGTLSHLGTRNDNLARNKRYMIYVHSKLMIVDDRYVLLGSSNLNERSLAGDRDTEICVGLWPSPGRGAECIEQVQALRKKLWIEHLDGTRLPSTWTQPESLACVESMRKAARQEWERFRSGAATVGHLAMLPLGLTSDPVSPKLIIRPEPGTSDSDYLPDAANPRGSDDSYWTWRCPGPHYVNSLPGLLYGIEDPFKFAE